MKLRQFKPEKGRAVSPAFFCRIKTGMMNQAAGLVSGAIGDGVFKTVVLGGRAYTVYAPTIYVIAKLLRPLGCVDLEGAQTKPEVVRVMPAQGRWIALAVAVAITGDVRFAGVRAWWLHRRLLHATPRELFEAFREVVGLIQAQDFFDCATLAREVANQMARRK